MRDGRPQGERGQCKRQTAGAHAAEQYDPSLTCSPLRARALTLRVVTLLAAASAAIHQLRYAIGYGDAARHELAVQGHAYLVPLLPFAAALGVVALASMLRAPLTAPRTRRASLRRLWANAFAALVAVYMAQELLEGALASGHPGGLAGVLGGDGWVAIALAAPAALLVALGVRGDEALAHGVAARINARRLAAPPHTQAPAPDPHRSLAAARLLPARGPPVPVVG